MSWVSMCRVGKSAQTRPGEVHDDVIIQYDTSGSKAAAIFGSARAAGELKREVDLYRDLGDSGSAVVMQLELQKEAALQQKDAAAANAKTVGKGGGGAKGTAGGGGKKK